MKTKTQVLKDNQDFKSLINNVITQLGGTDYLSDIANHGASAGWPGFTYYSDTHEFAMKNRKAIVSMLQSQADDFGMEIVEMVSGFGQFRGSGMDNEEKMELYKFIGGGKCEQSSITNLMAWYALEEVARMFEN